jgi:hypothetical protein
MESKRQAARFGSKMMDQLEKEMNYEKVIVTEEDFL